MDSRIALKNRTVLRFDERNEFVIENELARGGSSIVYNAYYFDNVGDRKNVRIKECYPFKCNIDRSAENCLVVSESDKSMFEDIKERMLQAYRLNNEFLKAEGLTNYTANTYNSFQNNNTLYIVSPYAQGQTLSFDTYNLVKDCVSVVKSVATTIQKIHNEGYLYLDIKPENVFTLDGTTQLIQLFDFDTLVPIEPADRTNGNKDCRISYTKGFAALEQQTEDLSRIGRYSDVYGIGALLFYLLFGRVPSAFDCEFDARYEYEQSRLGKFRFQDKLYFKVTEFFHNTLASYYPDRYQSMDKVITALKEIELLSDQTKAFIRETVVSSKPPCLFGRLEEKAILENWLAGNKASGLWITGMVGIGRTALIQDFIYHNQEQGITFLYVNYNDSVQSTICDDWQIDVHTVKKDGVETLSEYYWRKMSALREIITEQRAVLVVDNYTGNDNKELENILNVGWKVIVISDGKYSGKKLEQLEIAALDKPEHLHSLFEHHLGRAYKIKSDDKRYVEAIIENVAGHSLILELVAKQIQKSHLSIRDAAIFSGKYGFSNIAPEKVDDTKGTIKNIIAELFNTVHLTDTQKILLKTLSAFSLKGIRMQMLSDMLKLESKDDLNSLESEHWLIVKNDTVYLHPVIRETIRQWEWSNESKLQTIKVLEYLFKRIKLEGKSEEYPKQYLIQLTKLRRNYECSTTYKKWADKLSEKKGVLGEVWKERMLSAGTITHTNLVKLSQLFDVAEGVVEYCETEEMLRVEDVYKDLLFVTIVNTPRDREEFLLAKSKLLLRDPSARNGIALMELYQIIIDIYKERGQYDLASEEISNAKRLVKRYGSNYMKGMYHCIVAAYFDDKLSGFEEEWSEEDVQDLKRLNSSLDKAIGYMKLSTHHTAKIKLVDYQEFKANILIRHYPNELKQIDKLLNEVQKNVFKYCQSHSRYVRNYHLSKALYDAYINERPYMEVLTQIRYAEEIEKKLQVTELDIIDDIIIPKAMMMLELNEPSLAEVFLFDGIIKCEKHDDLLPYIRKKVFLYHCLLNVFDRAENNKRLKECIELIDREVAKYEYLGITSQVPEELREKIKN